MRVNQRIVTACLALAIALLNANIIFAVPLALEDFELPGVTTGSIDGQGNAGDWVSPWAGVAGQTIIDTSSSPLSKTLPDGTVIDGGNQALSVTGAANNIAAREFGTPLTGDVYIGFLMQFKAGTIDSNDFVTICFNDAPMCDFSTIPTIGLKAQLGPDSTDFMVRNASTGAEYSTKQIAIGETYYVVGHAYKSTGLPADPYDRFDLWVNPDLSAPGIESTPEATATAVSTVNAVSHIAVRSATLSGGDDVIIDGFQLASEWDDLFTPAPETIRITEVEYDATQSGNDVTREWIELYNYGDDDVNISGWEVEDAGGTKATIPVSSVIGAGEYYLLANNPVGFAENYPTITPDVDLSPNVGLSNAGDSLTLRNTKDEDVDFVAWEGEAAGWDIATGADAGESVCRIDDDIDTDMPADWHICASPSPLGFVPTPTISLSKESYTSIEGASIDTIQLVVDGVVASGQSVQLSRVGGSATSGNDFTLSSPMTVTVPAGVYDGTTATAVSVASFTIADDAVVESDETIDISISTPSSGLVLDATTTATYTIQSDDVAGFSVTESSGSTRVDENGGTDMFSIVLDAEPETTVVIDLFSGDTSEATVGHSQLVFTPVNWSISQPITVTAVDDFIVSATTVTVTAAINDALSDDLWDLVADQTVLVSIIDDEIDTDGDSIEDSIDPDDDGDGVEDSIEAAGPNEGDTNGDGTADRLQSHVAASINPLNNNAYFALESSAPNCNLIKGLSVNAENEQLSQSEQFDFPLGLFDFTIQCAGAGDSTTITFYLDKLYDTSQWEFVKYDRTTRQYASFNPLVTYGVKIIGGAAVTTMSYDVSDGQFLDEDGVPNGTIVDPAGPAIVVQSSALVETGARVLLTTVAGLTSMCIAAATFALRRKQY